MSLPYTWAIMPILGAPDLTEAAILDVLAQSIPTKLLLINQGVDTSFREHLEQIAEQNDDRVFVWHHDPCLPSLSASWNTGLRFVWACGGEEAWVVNNDLRLRADTLEMLRRVCVPSHALFVSAVGVTKEQFDPTEPLMMSIEPECTELAKGGPDFSCFLVTKEGHEKYPFDENFSPAYGEDCNCHREYMLGGDGDKIFSVNIPYLHYASGTLKSMDPEKRAALEKRINEGSRAYYQRRWGGPVNYERFTIPFEPASAQDGVTNPDLQRACLACT